MTLRDHLSHLHGDDRGGSGAGGGGGGRRDHTSVGDRSDDAHSRRRDKTAPPPANPPPVNPPPALNAATSAGASTTSCSRSKDHRQQNGNSSADEIDTPTAGLGPGGRRIRRRPREWPDVPGTMPVMPTGRALDNGEVLEPRQDEVGAGVGRVGESSSARAAVTGGGDTDYSNVRSREQQANRKVGGGSRGRDDETRPIEKMRPDYPATAAGSGKGGGDTRSARRSSSGAMTVNYQHGSAILSARVPRRNMSPLPSTSAHLSSGRKRSRLELGDSNRYVAYEEGVLGGKRHETSRRHVMVEMPDIRRRPSPCTTRAGRELQAAAIDQGPATAAAGSGSRRKSSTTASALQFNQRPPLPSRAPNGGVSDMSVEDRSGGDDAGGDDSDVAEDHRGEPAGKDWIQCIETGTPPMTRAPSLGPTSEQASAGRNRPISTSISEHGAGRGANAKLRDDAYRLPSAVSVMPLATRSGENRAGGERGDHSAGEESAEQTLYPQLTMAVVSPKKQSKRLHQHQHRQRHGIENTTNRSNSPMSSREQRNEANVTVGSNGSGGGDGSESRGDSSGGGGGASDGKQFGGVGNVYHPEERGLGWGRSGRAEAHSPKPHKYQEVRQRVKYRRYDIIRRVCGTSRGSPQSWTRLTSGCIV